MDSSMKDNRVLGGRKRQVLSELAQTYKPKINNRKETIPTPALKPR